MLKCSRRTHDQAATPAAGPALHKAVFRHVKGVNAAVSGYAGGSKQTAQYVLVSTGSTGHAESVQVTYDPSQVSYGELLRIFFSVAHDPTQLNRQGPDVGPQYRSAVFFVDTEQKRVAEAYIAQLTAAGAFAAPIVTQVVPLPAFYPAEEYHQNYLSKHPTEPYIVYNDLPKLAALKEQFPARYIPEQGQSRNRHEVKLQEKGRFVRYKLLKCEYL